MPDAPKSFDLLRQVEFRLRIMSLARAVYYSSLLVLGLLLILVLTVRLLGLFPEIVDQPMWLLAAPAVVAISAAVFHRRVERQMAARVIDTHAQTRDLFLTLASLTTSAGEYQPLVTATAETRAEKIVPSQVAPFRFQRQLITVANFVSCILLTAWLLPQLDPFGAVEAGKVVEQQKQEIAAIRKEALVRRERLEKEAQRADEESKEIDDLLGQLRKDFRQMQPTKADSNAKVLDSHRQNLGEKWKSAAADQQLRQMVNQPISKQQLSGTRSQKSNEWLKELQEGKSDLLQQQLQQAQKTMQAMLEAKTPEEREKLAAELKKDLQDLNSFAKNKANSKALADALGKAMKSLQAAESPQENGEKTELSKDAMEALKESLQLSEQEMEKVAQAAQDLKKLEDALKTLQQAQKLNQQQNLDGSRCEGCETMEDYAELYAQMMGEGEGGEGRKSRNEGGGRGVGRGGETPEDDSDPEGYKTEKERPQVQAGKVLLSIKSKDYAQEKDFDPEKMREYQNTVSALKSSVQSAIDTEEIPPGYVESIKGYFDKIEAVDPQLEAP